MLVTIAQTSPDVYSTVLQRTDHETLDTIWAQYSQQLGPGVPVTGRTYLAHVILDNLQSMSSIDITLEFENRIHDIIGKLNGIQSALNR